MSRLWTACRGNKVTLLLTTTYLNIFLHICRGGRFITISEKYNPLTGKINVTMEHDII